MAADLKRYTFSFDGDMEVHYLAQAPAVGERVSHGRELWFVAEVSSDPLGPVVVCTRSDRTRGGDGEAVEAHIAER
jgi:hypothetical protein